MEITRRTDYAVRMVLELARRSGKPLSVRTLAESQDIPYAFARGIQRDLTTAGLVRTQRGAYGGALLARPPDDITLLDVIQATQSTLSAAACTRDLAACERMGNCSVHRVWREADEMMTGFLGSKSLVGLIEKREAGEERHGCRRTR
jgi:Rrf2 family protein